MKEFIQFSYEVKDLTEKGVVTFYANAFNNKDSDDDISLPGSFKKTLRENGKKLRHFKNHDYRQMPGAIISAKEDDFGLLVESQLILDTQLGAETFAEYKALNAAGKQTEHSIGVNAIKYEMDEKSGIRSVSEWKLWEVSTLNGWGANPGALVQGIKSVQEMTKEDMATEIIFLKALLNLPTYDELKLEQIERQLNYLSELKAALGAADQHSASRTFEEWRKLIKI
jgi:HK97 family phage prohead protease